MSIAQQLLPRIARMMQSDTDFDKAMPPENPAALRRRESGLLFGNEDYTSSRLRFLPKQSSQMIATITTP